MDGLRALSGRRFDRRWTLEDARARFGRELERDIGAREIVANIEMYVMSIQDK